MASVNQHIFFCIESNCDAEAHVSGGRCDGCFEAEITYLRELHNPTRCDYCHERINCGIDSDALYCETAVFCGKWCEAGYALANLHTCSGEFDYERDCYVCDDQDDPLCPFNPSQKAKSCDWYWYDGQRHRLKKSCADCGYTPEDGHFPAYRGHDPLCVTCEEEFYGPASPEDWRERSGHCTKCNSNFLIICSSDDRTCCRVCTAAGALPPATEELNDCPGCGGSSRPGANGYCSACWHQRYGCDVE